MYAYTSNEAYVEDGIPEASSGNPEFGILLGHGERPIFVKKLALAE
ncbi:hypothetical protein [Algoriphagus sp. NG3]|nr:hypothetical protein [Algoriphagus sp. NG3]WPR77534.1 hypothetical protein SLW71_09260 [Algoriphagus sp. NG3]